MLVVLKGHCKYLGSQLVRIMSDCISSSYFIKLCLSDTCKCLDLDL